MVDGAGTKRDANLLAEGPTLGYNSILLFCWVLSSERDSNERNFRKVYR
jgi:hypothetical protein